MKKLINLLVVTLCFILTVQAKTTTETTTVLFNTAQHNLTKQAINELKEFLKNNKTPLDYEVTIEGHTDSRGNLAYNKQLSLKRANQVKQFLVKNGIDEKLIAFNYKGELDPEKPNINDKNMTANRRVEVTLTTYRFDNIQELEEALNPNKTSFYIINPNKENLIKGNKGVKVLIAPNSFTYDNGKLVTEDVKFELTESLKYKDFISSGLLTQTPDALLESGGMIKLNATSISGKPVQIKSDKKMLIAIPNENRKDNMEVFTSDKGASWTAKNQPISNTATSFSINSFPMMTNKNIKLPQFTYKGKDKPVAPIPPGMSRLPHEPRAESYIKKVPWYKFHKERRRKQQQYYYKKAMGHYYKRLDRYERNEVSYKKKMVAYKKALGEYNIAMNFWQEKVDQLKAEFKNSSKYRRAAKRHNAIYQENLLKYKKAVAEWRASRKKTMAEKGSDMDRLGIADKESLNNYVFAFNELTWINVDRFYHMSEKDKQVIVMKTDEIKDERVLILFKNIGSMLSMYPNKKTNEYTQTGFPKKEEAVIFAYKVENGKPMLCYREIDGSSEYHLDYISSSFAEIKAILSQFDGPKNS
jgi:OmpA family